MVTMCEQCGDKGFRNAFVFCTVCLEVAVHRYCLFKLPKTFDEFVPWACEECESDLAQKSTFKRPREVLFLERTNTSSDCAQVVNTGVKLKGKGTAHLLLETVEHGLQSGLSKKTSKPCQYLNLSEQGHLSGDCSSPKKKPRKEKDLRCSVPKLHKWRSKDYLKNRPHETNIELNVLECAKVDISPLKVKLGKKPNATSTIEPEELEHQNSPLLQACEPYILHPTEHTELDGHHKSQFDDRKISESVAELEEHRRPSSSFQLEVHTKDPAEHGQLHTDFTPLDIVPDNRKDGICSLAETEGQKYLSINTQQLPRACMEAESTDRAILMRDACDLNEKEKSIPICGETCKNDLNLEKQSKPTLDNRGPVDKKISGFVNSYLSNMSEVHSHLPAQPVIDPIWSGSFNIYSKKFVGTFDGLVSHLSSKACPKVCEVASLLPSLLSLEMLPRSDLWPKSFKKSEPSDDHIALYFFPESHRYERAFDCFVEDMLGNQLAMRATVKNAELLVFTSIELPLQYWRFQGKHYLWGVFRNKPVSSSQVNHQLRIPDGCKDISFYSSCNSNKEIGDPPRTKRWDSRRSHRPLRSSGFRRFML